MGCKGFCKTLEIFPDHPDRPLLLHAIGAERLIDGDRRIDPRIGVRPERLGIRGVFPAEFFIALLRLCRDTLCPHLSDILSRDHTGGFDESVHGSLLRFPLDAVAAVPAVSGVGLVPNEAEVAELPAPAQGLSTDEIRVGQIPVVDDIRLAAHGAQL